MILPRLQLDFANPNRSGGMVGAVLLIAGLFGFLAAGLHAYALKSERQGLELLEAAREQGSDRNRTSLNEAAVQAARPTLVQLATPWTQLLSELERVGKEDQGQIAVLVVEPDPAKHRITVAGESKNLGLALAFVERLRAARVLINPMLDSHEIKQDDPQHPVHFEVSADWSDHT